MEPLNLTIGIDIGQKRDPTAIALVEATEDRFVCRFLQRLPLNTSYPHIATRLREIVGNAERNGRKRAHATWLHDPDADAFHPPVLSVTTYLDATGVGTPVLDVLRESGLRIVGCYFTHGDRRTEDGGRVTIGKAWLVSRLQALFQTGRLLLPATHPEAPALKAELMDYEIKVSADANDRYGAFKTGSHDDLVTALGLAVQTDRGTGFAELPDFAVEELARFFDGRELAG